MSLLGFGALGSYALGSVPQGAATNTVMPVSATSYAITTVAVSFKISEAVAVSAFAITGISTGFNVGLSPTAAAYTVTGVAQTYGIGFAPASASYLITGIATTDGLGEPIVGVSYTITFSPVPLIRTGDNTDQVYGGIGHYLVAAEEARQLARITRTTPRPIDRTTPPQFRPVASPPIAPSAPVIDLQAIQNQRMAEQQQATAQAATIKRRREEEGLLLLVG